MEDKNPLILVFYIEIGNLDASDVNAFMEQTRQTLKLDKDTLDCVQFFIPTRNGISRVECINPKVTAPEVSIRINDILGRLDGAVAELVKTAKV